MYGSAVFSIVGVLVLVTPLYSLLLRHSPHRFPSKALHMLDPPLPTLVFVLIVRGLFVAVHSLLVIGVRSTVPFVSALHGRWFWPVGFSTDPFMWRCFLTALVFFASPLHSIAVHVVSAMFHVHLATFGVVFVFCVSLRPGLT